MSLANALFVGGTWCAVKVTDFCYSPLTTGHSLLFALLCRRQLLYLDLAYRHDAAGVVLLNREVPLGVAIFVVHEIDGGLAVHLDDDVIANGDHFLREPR